MYSILNAIISNHMIVDFIQSYLHSVNNLGSFWVHLPMFLPNLYSVNLSLNINNMYMVFVDPFTIINIMTNNFAVITKFRKIYVI